MSSGTAKGRSACKVVFIADPHLAEYEPGHQASFEEVLRRTKEIRNLALVVVLGDLTMEERQDEGLFGYARAQLSRFDVPVKIIPGNQDVGNPIRAKHGIQLDPAKNVSSRELRKNLAKATLPKPPPVITREKLRWFEERFGPFPWTYDVDTVRIIGINSQLVGSGFDEETTQMEWLPKALADARREKSYVVLAMHIPPYIQNPAESDAPDYYWSVPSGPRASVLDVIAGNPPDLMLTGHVHRQLTPPCNFCRFQTLASTSFQSHMIWSMDTTRVPEGSDDFSYYTLTIEPQGVTFERHILQHQNRFE